MNSNKLRGLIAMRSVIAVAVFMVTAAAQSAPSEYAVKTAIVYKIAKFVSWPDSAFQLADGPLNICLAQGSPFAKAMRSLQGRTVQGHRIQLVSLESFESITPDCQVLVISHKESKQAEALLMSVASLPVLTIGDADGFAERGGIVGLEIEQSKVGFAINVSASERVGLGIRAQLLQLARIVGNGEV